MCRRFAWGVGQIDACSLGRSIAHVTCGNCRPQTISCDAGVNSGSPSAGRFRGYEPRHQRPEHREGTRDDAGRPRNPNTRSRLTTCIDVRAAACRIQAGTDPATRQGPDA